MKHLTLLFALAFFTPTHSWATQIEGLSQKLQNLGFSKYATNASLKKVKIAVLDKGFEGYQSELGKSLPVGTVYHSGPMSAPTEAQTTHGLRMAQILVQSLTLEGKSPQFEPELHLYNVFGFTNFQSAVDDLIQRKVDLVLYSEVWEFGSNFKGDGFINSEVNRATAAGVLWINAAGNFHLSTYNTSIKSNKDLFVILPNENQSLKVICPENPQNKCQWKIVLSWNDFKSNSELGTEKNLDLALTDDFLSIIQKSELRQSADPQEARPGYSKYPREIITAEVKPGTYFLRVKNRSENFRETDSLRITVDGDFVAMPSRSTTESLLNPADNSQVITVGAFDSDRSSVSHRLNKPELWTVSSLFLDGVEYRGSSNSAALVAAGIALAKAINPKLTKDDLLKLVARGARDWNAPGLPLAQLQFSFTGQGCFQEVNFPSLPKHLEAVLDRGGIFVQTNMGARIMVSYDPLILAPHLQRKLVHDVLLATPNGYRVIPRNAQTAGPEEVEVFQRPMELGLCRPPASGGSIFGLP